MIRNDVSNLQYMEHDMWLKFFLVFAAHTALLLVPGYLLLRALRFPRPWALCFGSLAGIACVSILGEAYSLAGIPSGPTTILPPILVVAALLFLVSRRAENDLPLPSLPLWIPLLYMGVGVALGYVLYVSRLVSPDAVFQAYDSTQHINLIRAFADSGHFSSLGTNFYLTEADAAINPFPGGAFYPAGWHMICALLVQLTGADVPLVICVSQFAFIGVVFPLSVAALLGVLFPDEPGLVGIGSIACLSFVTFPWTFLFFGPIIANLAAASVVPALMAVFISMFAPDIPRSSRAVFAVVFILFSVGVGLLHPNGIFTTGALLIPFCAFRIWEFAGGYESPRSAKPFVYTGVFLVAVAAVWYGLYRLPAFQPIVWHDWPPFASRFQEVVNILTLSYEFNFSSFEHAAQIPLAIAVVIGGVCAAHSKERRWLLISYLFACFICYIAATSPTLREIKHVIAGFWYTDPMRLGSMAITAAIPLACLGYKWLYDQIVSLVRSYNGKHTPTDTRKIAIVLSALLALITFMPDFNLPGTHYSRIYNKNLNDVPTEEELAEMSPAERRWKSRRDTSIHTPFGDYRSSFDRRMAYNSALYDEEIAFIDRVKSEVPEGALILNDPMDGSFLAYGFDGLRVYYRNFVSMGYEEQETSRLIREHLKEISENQDVAQAVDSLGASYVLVLSQKGGDESFIDLRNDYDPSQYSGINTITSDTPGFELVFSQDDMALYRIV